MGVYVLQPLALKVRVEPPPSSTTIKNQLLTSIKNQVLAEKDSALVTLIKYLTIMELNVKRVQLTENKDGKLLVNLFTKEEFDGFKLNEETGEFENTKVSKLTFSLKNLVFVLINDKNIEAMFSCVKSSDVSQGQFNVLLKNAKIEVDRKLVNDGDTFVDEFGEEQVAERDMYLTKLVKVEVANPKKVSRNIIKANDPTMTDELIDMLLD